MAKKKSKSQTTTHEGGVNISGGRDTSITGDVAGRDQTKTTTSTTITTTTTGIDAAGLAQLLQQFQQINTKIDALPDKDDDEKQEMKETVKKIEEEVKKGEAAKPDKVERWIKFLAGMSKDVAQVTAAALVNPAAGIGTAIRLIAEKATQESKA